MARITFRKTYRSALPIGWWPDVALGGLGPHPAACAIIMGIILTAACQGGIIYSNLGPGGSFDSDAGLVISSDQDQRPSFAFTPGADYLLNEIDFAASLSSAGATNLVTVSLESDSSGVPGAVLATMTFNDVMGVGGSPTDPPILLTWSLSSPTEVSAGTQYWVTFDGPAPGADTWNYNVSGAYGDDFYNGSAWVATQNTIGALAIQGDAAPEAPEPGTFCLLAGVLTVGCFLMLRRGSTDASA